MVSLRRMAQCLGFSGRISVVQHFLGYRTQFSGRNISLFRQVQLLQNRYINLNIIRVGNDNFSVADREEIDFAIQTTRAIYAAVNLGVGRIRHFGISMAASNMRDVISDDAEAISLTNEWTAVPDDSLDVFVVLNGWAGTPGFTTLGLSEIDGSCDKNDNSRMNGTVISIRNTNIDITGQLLAHELGHYFGLSHVCGFTPGSGDCLSGTCQPMHQSSLMYPCARTTAVNISNAEFANINDHCFVKAGCPG
jgi:Metallo-peptidase family M12B Reprolysin-like